MALLVEFITKVIINNMKVIIVCFTFVVELATNHKWLNYARNKTLYFVICTQMVRECSKRNESTNNNLGTLILTV